MNETALTSYLDRWAEKEHIAGFSACIISDGEPVYTHANGRTNADGTARPDPDTMYGIGSLSKSLTALSACILAVEGKLDLESPVTDWLPGFRFPLQHGTVTVRHLCMHTSGLPPMEALEWSSVMNTTGRPADEETIRLRESAPSRVSTLEELLSCIAECPYPPVGAPGERFSYSNEGYALLSYVIDRAAGIPLEDFMRERIFLPLGMTRSILDNGVEASRELANGNFTSLFSWDGERQVCDDGWSILPPYRGCAMVKSTARDLARYYATLSSYGRIGGRQVIPEEAVRMLVCDTVPAERIPAMCLGINKRKFGEHVICDHGGALHGLSAKGAFLLGEGYGFAVLTNEDGADLDHVVWAMENAILGRSLEKSHEWFIPSDDACPDAEHFAGAYEDHEGLPEILTISISPEGLTAEKNGRVHSLQFCGETRFLATDSEGRSLMHLTFHPEGSVCNLVSCGSRIFRRSGA